MADSANSITTSKIPRRTVLAGLACGLAAVVGGVAIAAPPSSLSAVEREMAALRAAGYRLSLIPPSYDHGWYWGIDLTGPKNDPTGRVLCTFGQCEVDGGVSFYQAVLDVLMREREWALRSMRSMEAAGYVFAVMDGHQLYIGRSDIYSSLGDDPAYDTFVQDYRSRLPASRTALIGVFREKYQTEARTARGANG